MTIAYFLELTGSAEQQLTSVQIRAAVNQLQKLPNIERVNLFTPETSHDPFLDDGAGPLLVMQMCFKDKQSFGNTLESTVLSDLIEQLKTLAGSGKLVQEAMQLENYKSGSGAVSYLVNYHRPAEDESAFLGHYRAHHPPIMLRFPGLRSLRLGLPMDWQPITGIDHADRMLFCEVSFDDIDALNAALASEVRKELRKDYQTFPAFSGAVTHYAVHRYP